VISLVHDINNLCKVWHKRLGHLNHGSLPILKDMVQGLPDFKVEKKGVCKVCALEKNVKLTFPSSEHRSREILDLIHIDVCGSMSSMSLFGIFFTLFFIDDSSRKPWFYFMKAKVEVFEKFQEFRTLVENMKRKINDEGLTLEGSIPPRSLTPFAGKQESRMR